MLLRILLSPVTSAAAMAGLLYGAGFLPFIAKAVLAFAGTMAYVVMGPTPKRNLSLWRLLGSKKGCQQMGEALAAVPELRKRDVPVVVLSFTSGSAASPEFLSHALLFGGVPNVTTMYLPDRTQSLAHRLPVARSTLFFVGGVVAYSRNLLLRILQRRPTPAGGSSSSSAAAGGAGTGAGNAVVVALQAPIANHRINMHNKGVFSAAIKAGALILPVVSGPNGEPAVGRVVKPAAVADLPKAEDVREFAAAVGKELEATYAKVSQSKLVIIDL